MLLPYSGVARVPRPLQRHPPTHTKKNKKTDDDDDDEGATGGEPTAAAAAAAPLGGSQGAGEEEEEDPSVYPPAWRAVRLQVCSGRSIGRGGGCWGGGSIDR